MAKAKKPVFYTGGGVVNSGPRAAALLRELVKLTGYPITSTLMGLGAFPASDPQWLGMLGMHGTFEANNAMHDCDLMIAHRRALRRPHHRPDQCLLAGLAQDPRRYRCLVDQQEHPRRRADRRRRRRTCSRRCWPSGSASRRGPTRRRPRRGGARSTGGGRAIASPIRTNADIIMPQYAIERLLGGDQGQGRLHHHRGRPAPDVGGAVLQVRGAQPLDDLRRPRHHGLRPAGGGRRAGGASRQPWSSTSPATARC